MLRTLVERWLRPQKARRTSEAEAARLPPSGHTPPGTSVAQLKNLQAQGDLALAMRLVDAWLEASPRDVAARLQRATLLFAWGRALEANAALEQLFAEPDVLATQERSLGELLLALGRWSDALAVLTGPANAGDLTSRRSMCLALRESGRLPECIQQCDVVLDTAPNDIEVLLVRSLASAAMGDACSAESAANRVLDLDPANALALFVVALLRKAELRFGEALELTLRAIAADAMVIPYEGYLELATLYDYLNRGPEAIDVLTHGLTKVPRAELHRALGQTLLREGRFQEGWAQHEYRWFISPMLATRMRGKLPPWEGQSLVNKTLLLRAEQGYGDLIQFVRYAPSLKEMGARIVMGQIELAERFHGVDGLLGRDVALEEVDYYVNVMSLPHVFRTNLSSIPLPIPYVSLSEDHSAKWESDFSSKGRRRVGIVWAGNPAHVADKQRSIALSFLRPLLETSSTHFYSLQKETRNADDLSILEEYGVENLGPRLETYDDTAAVINNLDLVVSVDTSVAHLAGALGKPVWVLLPEPSDWRWMRQRDDSPWYPTMRLFRQMSAGDWAPVVEGVVRAMADWIHGPIRALPHRNFTVARSDPKYPDPFRHLGAIAYQGDVMLGYVPPVGSAARHKEGLAQRVFDQVLNRLSLDGGVAIETGAAPGAWTIRLARAVGEERGYVLAYESRREMAGLLSENLRANDVRNVSVIARGLGNQAAAGPGVDYVDALGLSRLDIVVLDVAQAAQKTLEGGEQTLWRLRPSLILEVQSAADAATIVEWLGHRAYRAWSLHGGGLPEIGCVIALPEESEKVGPVAELLDEHVSPTTKDL